MQVTLLRDDEHVVGLNDQVVGDQLNWHRRVVWEDLRQHGSYGSEVIYDDDGDPQVSRQILQQPNVCIETTSRTSHAYDREVPGRTLSIH